jgi:hypothetical protein
MSENYSRPSDYTSDAGDGGIIGASQMWDNNATTHASLVAHSGEVNDCTISGFPNLPTLPNGKTYSSVTLYVNLAVPTLTLGGVSVLVSLDNGNTWDNTLVSQSTTMSQQTLSLSLPVGTDLTQLRIFCSVVSNVPGGHRGVVTPPMGP